MRFAADQKMPGDIIFSENVKTTEGYALLNFEVTSISSFREKQNQPFA